MSVTYQTPIIVHIASIANELENDYIIDKHLGSGADANVKRIVDRVTRATFACKSFLKKDGHITEMKIFERLPRHPNVVNLHRTVHDSVTHLIMEYASGGDLMSMILDRYEMCNPLREHEVKWAMQEICMGVKHLHDNGVVHGDLKPENILIHLSIDDVASLKICDFSRSYIQSEGERAHYGTLEYSSREMLNEQPCAYHMDVWAVGIIMYCMMTGRFPFVTDTPEDMIKRINQQLTMSRCIRDSFSKSAIDLVGKLLTRNPSKRPTIDQVLQHSFFD